MYVLGIGGYQGRVTKVQNASIKTLQQVINGNQGITGPQGIQGVTGLQGITGKQGVQGITGAKGLTGDKGPTGNPGPDLLGSKGDIIYHNGTQWTTLAIGATGYVLKQNNGVPSWAVDNNSDTKVTQDVNKTDNTFPVLASAVANASNTQTTTAIYAPIKINPNKKSVAEGEGTTASGNNSQAEGNGTVASGNNSHAEGLQTIAQNVSEHSEGSYNVSHKISDTYGDAGNTQHTIGIGTGIKSRKNAFEIMQNGDAYLLGVGNYDGVHIKSEAGYETVKTLKEVINGKQDTLTAGQNIVITNNTISAVIDAGFNVEVVQTLPETGEANTIYFVPKEGSANPDVYNEYMYINSAWEKIGSTEVDLSNYYNKTEVDGLLEDKQDKLTAGNNITINGSTISANDTTYSNGNGISIIDNIISITGYGDNNSITNGTECVANGENSHAEGFGTIADGANSHTEGIFTQAYNIGEHAQGQYNISHTRGEQPEGNTIISAGIGTSENDRKNAFEITQNGDIYIYGLGNYNGTEIKSDNNPEIKTLQEILKTIADAVGIDIGYLL